MSFDALKAALPAYARDLGSNLSALEAETVLGEQQKWGCFVAAAHAVRSSAVIRAVEQAAAEAGLTPESANAAKAAAAIMAMNNIYYGALHAMRNTEYRALPTRLRMNVINNPGVAKADFELWAFTVSAINGCVVCMDAHEGELKRRGLPSIAIQAAVRIAAVTHAVAQVVTAEEALAG
jgi:alkyl hydroperoxide reductase subunit D